MFGLNIEVDSLLKDYDSSTEIGTPVAMLTLERSISTIPVTVVSDLLKSPSSISASSTS